MLPFLTTARPDHGPLTKEDTDTSSEVPSLCPFSVPRPNREHTYPLVRPPSALCADTVAEVRRGTSESLRSRASTGQHLDVQNK